MPSPPEPRCAIRPAARADAAALAAARAALFREIGRLRPADDEPFRARCRAEYERLFDSGAGAAWLAEDRAREVAAALTLLFHARLPSPELPAAIEGYVSGVWTRPDRRREGLASALLRAAIDDARRRGCARLRLRATEDGRRLYAAHGFSLRGDMMELAPG